MRNLIRLSVIAIGTITLAGCGLEPPSGIPHEEPTGLAAVKTAAIAKELYVQHAKDAVARFNYTDEAGTQTFAGFSVSEAMTSNNGVVLDSYTVGFLTLIRNDASGNTITALTSDALFFQPGTLVLDEHKLGEGTVSATFNMAGLLNGEAKESIAVEVHLTWTGSENLSKSVSQSNTNSEAEKTGYVATSLTQPAIAVGSVTADGGANLLPGPSNDVSTLGATTLRQITVTRP